MKNKSKIYSSLYYVGLFFLLGLPIFVGLTLQVVDGTFSTLHTSRALDSPTYPWSACLAVASIVEVFWLIPIVYFALPDKTGIKR